MFEKSKWIKAISNTKTEFYDQSPAPYIARSFELADEVAKATLNICGLGEAAYFLNGKIIPDSYRPTAWTNVLKNVTYNVFDVTDILHKCKINVFKCNLRISCYYNFTFWIIFFK